MYTRLTRSGGRSYLQIVEGFRTEAGVRQRVVANLGRLDQLEGKKLDPLIHGLQRALGRVPVSAPVPQYDTALAFGDVYALNEVWASLGFGEAIRRALRSSRRLLDAEALVRAGAARREPARADPRRPARLDPQQPGQGDGRNADQGRARRARQHEGRLLPPTRAACATQGLIVMTP